MHRRLHRRAALAALAVAVVTGAVTGCASPGAGPTSSPTGSPPSSPSHTTDLVAGWSLEQQVGQIFMVGTTATAAQPVTLGMISNQDLDNVFLSGRSKLGTAGTAAVSASLRAAARASAPEVPMFIATDQEGGQVQVLQGAGFDAMPSGVKQGELGASALQQSATRWASQLEAAGVNMNLAPVVDLVGTPALAAGNPPIGGFQRELGFTVASVQSSADALRAGYASGHVQTVLKHFPGLGFVSANTDTTAGVTDTTVTATGADVGIYRHEIAMGAGNIMVSSAIYSRIDPAGPAVFSRAIVTGLLRDTLNFRGLILTDDLSGATQVEYLAPADRAIDAIEAGVDIVLVSKDPTVGPAMMSAVLAKAKSDPAFARLVTAAARRVVAAKVAEGLAP